MITAYMWFVHTFNGSGHSIFCELGELYCSLHLYVSLYRYPNMQSVCWMKGYSVSSLFFNFIPLRYFRHILILSRNLFQLVLSVKEADLGKLTNDINDDIVSATTMTE